MIIKALRNALAGAMLAFSRFLPAAISDRWSSEDAVEPQKETDEWDELMDQYTDGTPEEQARAEAILMNKEERDKIFLKRFLNKGVVNQKNVVRGTRWSDPSVPMSLEALREQSEQNARDRVKLDTLK